MPEQQELLSKIHAFAWVRAGIGPELSKCLTFRHNKNGWSLAYMGIEGAKGDALAAFCKLVNEKHKDMLPKLVGK